MPAMLEVRQLTKYYGSYVGVEDVTFSVDQGEVVGFLGPNGAGKTTTMRVLTCAMPATRGSATVAGFDVMRNSLDVRRNVGYLPETPPLYHEMTVHAYLKYVATIKGVESKRVKERLDYALDACGIAHMTHRITGQLSKGYRQRVGIAQALIHDPSVLILDEPTSGLDPGQIIEIRELIKRLGEEHTVILSTHLLSEAQMTCRRLLIISVGRLVGDIALDENGEMASIQTPMGETVDYGTTRTVRIAFRGGTPELERHIRNLPEAADVTDDSEDSLRAFSIKTRIEVDVRPALAKVAVEHGAELLELREMRPSLERVFLDLTHRDAAAPPSRDTLDAKGEDAA